MSGIPREVHEERTQRVVELTRQGLNAPEIAARLGVNLRTVQRHRARGGVARVKAPLISAETKRRAKLMLDDGATIAEVARTFGHAHTAFSLHFREYVLPPAEAGKFARMGREMARLEREAAVR